MSDLVAAYGLVLDPWQEEVLQAGLGERSDGRWAARQVGVSAPRQQGKTMLIVARVLAGLLLFGEQTIVVSAHRQDTAREVFTRLVQLIEDNPSLEDRVDFIARSEMREYVRMKTGQEVRFKARSAGSGRGFSCDCLLLDEAQILGAPAWSAILPTMSARPNPQVWLLGTPPTPSDDGEVFARIRGAGLEKRGANLAYLEWSATENDDFDDPETWSKSNPSYGTRISHEAIEAERASMTDEQFGMERLGMWHVQGIRSVIPGPSWTLQEDSTSFPVDAFALGIEVGPEMKWASVALAGRREDGSWHVALEADQTIKGRGVEWLAPLVESFVTANPQIRTVVVDFGGPVTPLVMEQGGKYWLKRADGSRGVAVMALKNKELGSGCATLLNGVVVGDVWHIGQPQLTAAAMSATKRDIGDTGMWTWNRRGADSDITPIQACTYALVGAQMSKPKRPTRSVAAGQSSEGSVVVL